LVVTDGSGESAAAATNSPPDFEGNRVSERTVSARTFLPTCRSVGRYAAVVTMREGHVTRVEEHPHLASEAVGVEDDVA